MEKEAPPRDVVDARTVFIRDLPFSLTDQQLEEVFSEVGPVRHCFTVKDKGSEKNRGFGFVQFAVAEDASRAVDAKNGIALQGRKMKVELAKRRPPLDQRRPPKPKDEKPDKDSQSSESKLESAGEPDSPLSKKKRRGSDDEEKARDDNKDVSKPKYKKQKPEMPVQKPLKKNKRAREEGKSSDMQRPARTVVVGGLVSPEMKEAVLTEIKKFENIESQPTSMTEHELSSCGLTKDGCKPNAISVVFVSVRGARRAVAALHQQKICGGLVWARQLGGEGAKLKKWRLIVRNLPFKVREETLRELFMPAGFVWEVTIPRKPDGNARGFAFVGFTSKADAEKAISTLNMTTVEKRPIAVDWAVAKKNYETIVQGGDHLQSSEKATTKESSDVDEDTASEDDEEGEEEELVKAEGGKKKKLLTEAGDEYGADANVGKTRTNDLEQCSDMDLVRKIVDKIVSSNADNASPADHNNVLGKHFNKLSAEKSEQVNSNLKVTVPADQEADALARTVFVRNLPLDVKVPEMKELFSVFGEVRTFRLVYHKASKIPKGTAFLEFATVEAANAAVAASKGGQNEDKVGIEVRGQSLVLTIAMDRESVKHTPKPDTFSSVPHANGTDSINRTVFIRNLPSDVNVLEMREKFSMFGDVKSARLVLHPVTKRPKGTAFLEFGSVEAAKAAEAASKSIGKDGAGGIKLGGRSVKVDVAVGQQAARDISTKLSKEESGDRRNRHLAQEGFIAEGTPAAEGVSKADLLKRKDLMHEKATKLRSPNFHVSRTRLFVHNVPKTMSEADLKRIFVDAVLSRASKQKPVVKQVKILKDVTKAGGSKSRGTAFVEFTEHQHALVALRVLNNNPEVFGSEHRPIVEFAIENMKILEKRAKREAAAKSHHANKEANEGRKHLAHDAPKAEQKQIKFEDGVIKLADARKPRDGKRKITDRKTGNVEVEEADNKLTEGKDQKKKSVREVGKKRKRAPGRTPAADESGKGGPGNSEAPENEKQGRSQKKKKHRIGASPDEAAKAEGTTSKKVPNKEHVGCRPTKKPRVEQNGHGSRPEVLAEKKQSRRERRQTRKGSKPGEDRVDQLVTEYRSKYLSDGPGHKKPEGKSGQFVDDIRRWFE